MARFRRLLLFTGLALCALAVANPLGDDMETEGCDLAVLERRQDNNSTAVATDEETVTATPTSRPTTTIVQTSTASRTPSNTPTPPPQTTSSSAPSTVSSSPPPPSTSSTDSSSDDDGESETSTTQSKTTIPATTLPPTTRVRTTLLTTRSGEADVTLTETSTTIETPTMPAVTQTASAADQGDDTSDNSGGLDTSKRNTVIGVVVGVGGAILLGGLAIVIFRIKRRKNANVVDEDDLMRRDGSPLADSRKEAYTGSTDPSPFQATLDQYHRPAPVNASANF